MSVENSAHSPLRYFGSSFESMVESLGGAFGSFIGEPTGQTQEFHWGFDLCAHESAVWLSANHCDEFQLSVKPTGNTKEYLSIGVPRNGGMGVSCGSRTAEAGHGKLLLYNTLEVDSVIMYGRSNSIDNLSLNWSGVQHSIDQTFEHPLNGSLDILSELSVETPVGQTVANLAAAMICGMRNDGPLLHSPIAMAHVSQALADVVVRFVPHRLSYLLDRKPNLIAPRHVRRAIEFMEANISQPITVAAVAAAVNVSARALQNGFRAFRDTTPHAYLTMLRLRAAREDLCDPGNIDAVREICLKWGFFHFGRFSALYKTTYGENPSETRKSAGIR